MSSTDKRTPSSGYNSDKNMSKKRSEKVSYQSGDKEPLDTNDNNRDSPISMTPPDVETDQDNSQDQPPVGKYMTRNDGDGGQYRNGPNRNGQNRDSQNRNGQNRDSQYHDSQNRNGQNRNGQNRDSQNRDSQYRNGQNRDSQYRNGQNHDARERRPRDDYDRPSGQRSDNRNRHDRSEKQTNSRQNPAYEEDNVNPRENQAPDVVSLGTNTREFIELPESVNDFEDMKFLTEGLFRGIYEYGFKYPSPIQSKTVHIINSGCDLIAQSQSGSGKTGAFAIGSLSRVDVKTSYPQVVIIANTRLLALQIHKVVENIAKYMGIEVVACVGGQKNNSQMNAQQVKYAHVLVGTPGRMSEMLTKRAFDGKKVKILIMDETDVLLKDDFRPQIIDIIEKLSEKTQICIFSATFTKDTLLLTEKFLRDPYRVTVEKEAVSVRGIKQYKVDVRYERNKFATLTDLFTKLTFNQMIIFVRSIKSAEDLRNRLMDQNIQAGLVHGKMNSFDRENVLKEFRLSYIKILISTDVMCRGIDIDDLRIVINYDMPEDDETYIHRVGRSGRYGGQGVAINLCTFDDSHKIRILTREYNLDIQDMPDPEDVNMHLIGMAPPEGKVSSAKNYS
jgi:translation initiation factor 4A